MVREFVLKLSGEADAPVTELQLFGCRGITGIIRSMGSADTLTPLMAAKLFEECRCLAAAQGGSIARTFERYGLHDEQLLPGPVAGPPQQVRPAPRPSHLLKRRR